MMARVLGSMAWCLGCQRAGAGVITPQGEVGFAFPAVLAVLAGRIVAAAYACRMTQRLVAAVTVGM